MQDQDVSEQQLGAKSQHGSFPAEQPMLQGSGGTQVRSQGGWTTREVQ